MGWGQSKPVVDERNKVEITQVQSISNIMESKLNMVWIGILVVAVILGIILCYAIRSKCKSFARQWLMKTMTRMSTPTSVKVHSMSSTVPQQQQTVF